MRRGCGRRQSELQVSGFQLAERGLLQPCCSFTHRSLLRSSGQRGCKLRNLPQLKIFGDAQRSTQLDEFGFSQRPLDSGLLGVENPIIHHIGILFHPCVIRILWIGALQPLTFGNDKSAIRRAFNDQTRDDWRPFANSPRLDFNLKRRGANDKIVYRQMCREIGNRRRREPKPRPFSLSIKIDEKCSKQNRRNGQSASNSPPKVLHESELVEVIAVRSGRRGS